MNGGRVAGVRGYAEKNVGMHVNVISFETINLGSAHRN